ncbi:MAG: helix-turn-helix transcriptional regulator [Patescibacteria group bacterium]|nr:helix-turn-helix transcriptional regulator [Patescibacteria group bacterium]
MRSRTAHDLCMARTTLKRTFIRQWREYRGKSLEEVADKIGKHHSTLSRIERGVQGYNQQEIEALAVELQTDVVSLLTRDPAAPVTGADVGNLWGAIPEKERVALWELMQLYAQRGAF